MRCVTAGLALAALAIVAAPAAAQQLSPAAEAVIARDKVGAKLATPVRIGYVAECAQNSYCQARLKGMEAAAEKFGFEFKLYDANFNPAEQLKHVQNAVAEGFDGYIFAPTAGAPACGMWRNFLSQTGKPVVTVDLPMCGDADYTEGLAGTVTMQRQGYYDAHVANAFKDCTAAAPCKVAAVGGFVGSDLFNVWEKALKATDEANDNVEIVVDQPGNYDPRVALRVIQDALRANPDINMVMSSWDDMTRGVEQAIVSVGKTPGKDIKIISMGASRDGLARVKAGTWNGTTVLLPFEESYYGAVAMVLALEGKPVNGYIDEALLPVVTEGPGSIFITPDNADKLEPTF